MWEKILNLALSNGIWAVLFLLLLFFQIKDSREREIKYQQTIDSLGKSLEIINEVKEDVEIIKEEIGNMKPTLNSESNEKN